MRKFNDPNLYKATRMATGDPTDTAFGIAWYQGSAVGDEWEGYWVGNDPDPEKAEAFLRGEDVTPKVKGFA